MISTIAPDRMFQSALPRRERLGIVPRLIHMPFVSIRAPAKGATDEGIELKGYKYVSIRAPAKGATLTKQRDELMEALFQSALPRRERQPQMQLTDGKSLVSIRAPAKGATQQIHHHQP